ncbi:MAG: SPFH domain-containing protein [Microscillaceae bacterium]|jgi:major vault protein|nr:SPFH domain-containing protein [Microscillaceae bacterium]
MAEENRERDLVLAPNEYAFISDQTKGNINVYVGPYKTSLANTDKPVIFDGSSKRFERVSLDESIETFVTAPEGWYVVMKNPPKDGHQPKTGTTNNLAELNVGRKVNIPGPINFALWPGQMAKVLRGHNLRSNQYLLVRVYDEDEATKNWTKAVIKTKDGEGAPDELTETQLDLIMGKMLVIKGSNVSFYIPPTGVEVVPDDDDEYVREAVTLERLEYCILLDENGNKRFIQGPAVVFPEPTEEFIYREGVRKFKAIELNEMSGLYIKVIAPYTEGKISYKEGDELFITGKDQMIYYPRPEHAIIKYGKKERHYALAIPAGEGRYYLNRKTGKISLQKGPAMFLPDPREAVLVRRILHPKQVSLWFPGNQEALQYNQQLQKLAKSDVQDFISDDVIQMEQEILQPIASAKPMPEKKKEKVSKEIAGDEFERGEQFTPPRMLVLDTKYDGAVTINLWTGYAILIVSKTGTRKVIVGPQSYLLEYDENLEAFELSTGTPKTEDNTIKSVYLRVLHNKVSDIVRAETSDYTQVNIQLSYRLNFEGDPEKWFNVENYVKFLTDHLRSFLRNAVKKHTIMDFYTNGIEIIRDTILGKPTKDEKRPGRTFEENGMRIYDVEVLDIRLSDISLENLLIATQQDVVKQTLRVTSEQRRLEFTKETEKINQEIALAKSSTARQTIDLENEEVKKALELALVKIESEIQTRDKRLLAELTEQDTLQKISEAELLRQREREALQIDLAKQKLNQELDKLQAEVNAVVAKAQAVSPNLVAALQSFADKALAEKMAQSMSPLAILGGKSIAEVLANLLKGTVLSNVLEQSKNILPENE